MENKLPSIQVLGSGCPTCKKLFEITKQAIQELGLEITVDYVNDIQKIINMDLMQSPVLAVNNKPALIGFTPDIEKIKRAIKENL